MVSPDKSITFSNFEHSLSLFHFELAGWVVIIVTDLIVSWAFYQVLKPIHHLQALLATGLRLVYTIILALAVFRLAFVSKIVASTQMNDGASQVMSTIQSFETLWSIGLILFGAHLIMVGYVAMKSERIPKFLSIMLLIAGVSYMVVHTMTNGLPQYENVTATLELFLSAPMMIGEVGFGIWLLIKGFSRKRKPVLT